ncbi:TPA: LamG-like jellyroll fold domain-containing protein [Clostridium botulinum]|uniref:LamG-like jellyroll fold domain-containing protein n=1 Tax=Clostridium botulinum TaxID=1491 RepID=UPI000466ABF9|nr:LamG-like jellyroll fold domain-containing protein [Clostridium botulinum]APH20829.1 concanavalin A-like lectin/glucanases superfamily protein [Clostridium botulinum]APQ71126.1 concanavalin A-like lectin/glucanases superfamily protein [Clostridium botulinum]APR02457.1 concanavalin A-like lectin/glucanases superfamily protein [Clostridium botulinum]MBN3351918.1 hypothetical protein [Clostridium botulinum]MBN3359307.1 hypothetical protein [Clostridium botulinum]
MIKKYIPIKDYSNNLVAQYKFEETSGVTCIDSSGKGNNGIYVGTTSVTGENGNARSFNNFLSSTSAIDYINFNNSIIPTGRKTIKFKIKFKDNIEYAPILGNLSSSGGVYDKGLGFFIDSNKINVMVRDGSPSCFNFTSSNPINDGLYHQVMFTWDGTNDNDTIKLFIDDMINPNITTTIQQNEPIYSQNFIIGTRPVKSYGFKGELDEIEIYNEVVEFADKRYLLKQNNHYYTIKSDFYKNGNYESIPELEGKEILTKTDFETYGIDDLNLLTKNINTQDIKGTDKGNLGSGKLFEMPFNNDFMSISEVK